MAKKCKIYEVKYDSSVNIFETLFKTVYSENLSFPETKKYEFYCQIGRASCRERV